MNIILVAAAFQLWMKGSLPVDWTGVKLLNWSFHGEVQYIVGAIGNLFFIETRKKYCFLWFHYSFTGEQVKILFQQYQSMQSPWTNSVTACKGLKVNNAFLPLTSFSSHWHIGLVSHMLALWSICIVPGLCKITIFFMNHIHGVCVSGDSCSFHPSCHKRFSSQPFGSIQLHCLHIAILMRCMRDL